MPTSLHASSLATKAGRGGRRSSRSSAEAPAPRHVMKELAKPPIPRWIHH
jgi:hypothetical protein